MQGLGALFTIRTAGNVVGPLEAASAYYAASDLQVPLIAVVGHTGCGAIGAAQAGGPTDADLEPLLARVRRAIGTEPDPYAASAANVRAGLAALRATPGLAALEDAGQLMIVGAVLHTDTGAVDFLDR